MSDVDVLEVREEMLAASIDQDRNWAPCWPKRERFRSMLDCSCSMLLLLLLVRGGVPTAPAAAAVGSEWGGVDCGVPKASAFVGLGLGDRGW